MARFLVNTPACIISLLAKTRVSADKSKSFSLPARTRPPRTLCWSTEGMVAVALGQDCQLRRSLSVWSDHEALMCTSLTVSDWKWIGEGQAPARVNSPEGLHVTTQIRHRMRGVSSVLRRMWDASLPAVIPHDIDMPYLCSSPDILKLSFDEPIHAATPGQIAVVWDGDWCLGGGRIEDTVCLA